MWISLGFAALFLSTGMGVIWWISVRLHNASIVDIAWAAGFTPLVLLYHFHAPDFDRRQILGSGMVIIWSLRLAWHLYVRVQGHHPTEDARYAALRLKWGTRANGNMFIFFQLQGALMLILSWPFFLISRNTTPDLSGVEWVGLMVWLVAMVGESVADQQLKACKADPLQKGRVCQSGLWRYSRHPNYFFEWLIWVAFFLFALGSPWGWTAVLSPALMLYFLCCVTGIPATEQQSLASKGEAYREYQRRTPSAFFPWFPRDL